MKKTILILLVVFISFISCEKDPLLDAEGAYPLSKHKIAEVVFVELSKGNMYIPAGNINGNPFNIQLSFSINNNLWFYDSIYTNHAGIQYKIQTLKYILSDIYVHKYYDEIAGISFTMGLSKEKNISNSYVNEVFHPTMFWPDLIGGGYHYMKLEGTAYATDTIFYNTHTGGTNGNDYSFHKHLTINPRKHVVNTTRYNNQMWSYITLNMDLSKWYYNPNTINFEGSIMQNEQRQQQLKENGELDVFSIIEHQ